MNIFVGCSSRDTDNIDYNEAAKIIADYIASNGYNLVFGGCEKGLMGTTYAEVLKKRVNSKIIISMSDAFVHQLNGITYEELYHFKTASQRKEGLIECADAIVILPGGLGTIDELITAIEMKRNKEHNKQIVIVNINGFFNNIISMLNKVCEEGFIDSESKKLYFIADTAEEAVSYLNEVLKKE